MVIQYDSYGQPITTGVNETIGAPSSNPANADEVLTSAHYNNNSWLISKAIEMLIDDSTYSESYGGPDVAYSGTTAP